MTITVNIDLKEPAGIRTRLSVSCDCSYAQKIATTCIAIASQPAIGCHGTKAVNVKSFPFSQHHWIRKSRNVRASFGTSSGVPCRVIGLLTLVWSGGELRPSKGNEIPNFWGMICDKRRSAFLCDWFAYPGLVGRPGIIIMSPTSGYRKPAPTEAFTSRIGSTKPEGAPLADASALKEY